MASMGPRPLQPWKWSVLRGMPETSRLQWGHGFSAVEMAGYQRGKAVRFNGATAFQPWKSKTVLAEGARDNSASMGPRLFSRGNGR